jgi:uncharacterized membrane protein YcaP (DUF421 family)
MLIGDVHPEFLIEVIIRIILLYVLIIFSMRLMGRRMASTMSRNELAALVSLAAAIGIGMQDPTKGILPAFIIAGIIVGTQQLIAKLTFKNKTFESVTQGNFDALVEDGCLKIKSMSRVGLSRERIFSQLRSEGITHLGKMQRMYIEAGGSFTILDYEKPKPGLPIIPEWDQEMIKNNLPEDKVYCCGRCGAKLKDGGTLNDKCTKCNHTNWVKAIL